MASRNTIVKSIARKAIFDDMSNGLGTTEDFDQGDLLVFDAATSKLVKPSAETEGETFLGTSVVKIVDGKEASPYSTSNDAAIAKGAIPGPVYGVTALVKLKNGDALNFGDYVYLDPSNGAQHVQDSGTKPIGTYQGPSGVTGDGETDIVVLLGARYPNDVLKF